MGNDEGKIKRIVSEFLNEKASVTIKIEAPVTRANTLTLDYSLDNILFNASISAALVERSVQTYIKAGENRGVGLTNYNVVRDFKTMQLTNAEGNFILQLPRGSSSANYQVVLFVQENSSGIIQGAVKENCK